MHIVKVCMSLNVLYAKSFLISVLYQQVHRKVFLKKTNDYSEL